MKTFIASLIDIIVCLIVALIAFELTEYIFTPWLFTATRIAGLFVPSIFTAKRIANRITEAYEEHMIAKDMSDFLIANEPDNSDTPIVY